MKVYHVTTLIENGKCSMGYVTREHHDLGLHATWKGATEALAHRPNPFSIAASKHITGDALRYLRNEGRTWIDAEGQATRVTVSCPMTRTQWFIEQREVKA